ncbi:hypothetical protein Y032_0337g2906 [Ancylostoma ceylanicum]|uniref:Uncharacterized protein n=1 Tax=Ancylostoma ceylanicum TaxID=53326 RepID=A0A016RYH6_9BILA|nr:hypothetical protein Y032_0337g2906 [Ancylostoma ceylanicum]
MNLPVNFYEILHCHEHKRYQLRWIRRFATEKFLRVSLRGEIKLPHVENFERNRYRTARNLSLTCRKPQPNHDTEPGLNVENLTKN